MHFEEKDQGEYLISIDKRTILAQLTGQHPPIVLEVHEGF